MKRLMRIKVVLLIIAVFGFTGIGFRFLKGLGASTALSDMIPWGMWKVMNMVAGAALGTCGFVMAALVVVFRIKRFEPLLRPSILIAFLGYGSSCFALLLDIGLPWRIYNPFIYPNIHSFLFEVALCVTFYFTVTAIEMVPIVTEHPLLHRFHKIGHFIHHYVMAFVILGITLSSMHHTSLGALVIPAVERLHSIWYSPWINWIFIISAMGSGLMTLIFVTLTTCSFYNRDPDIPLLGSVGFISAALLCLYAVIKVIDLTARNQWGIIFNGQWEGYVFMLESFLMVILPVGLLLIPAVRRSFGGLLVISLSTMVGLTLNRLNVNIIGFFRSAGATYFPSLPELFVGFGVLAAAALIFLLIVENTEIYWKPVVKPKEI